MIIIIKKDGQIVTDDGNPIEGKALEGAYMLLADAQDGDSIVYDGTNHMWKAGSSFDPTITDPQNGDTLVYNATQQKWVNGDGGGSFDPTITNPQDGDTLVYNATQQKWVNGSGGSGGGFLKVNVNPETGVFDKTWKQIHDALNAGYSVNVIKPTDNTGGTGIYQDIVFSTEHLSNGMYVVRLFSAIQHGENTYEVYADTENDYPY